MRPPRIAALGALLLLLSGCSARITTPAAPPLDPRAPAAAGYPALPKAGSPSPVQDRPPFGLYAEAPNPDTLTALATGTLSPDGRWRGAITAQGAWIARVDGAWIWQVVLPAPPAPPTPAPKPGQPTPPPPQPPAPPQPAGAPVWTPQSTMALADTAGAWYEADPDSTTVRPMLTSLQGISMPSFSPDGSQMLYYRTTDKGVSQLWTAKRDGSQARLVGENTTGYWGQDGQLVTKKSNEAKQPAKPGAPSQTVPGSHKPLID